MTLQRQAGSAHRCTDLEAYGLSLETVGTKHILEFFSGFRKVMCMSIDRTTEGTGHITLTYGHVSHNDKTHSEE